MVPALHSAFRGIGRRLLVRSMAQCPAAALALACLLAPASAATREDWPLRPVTIIVPFPPGGNTDSMARILAQKLSAKFRCNFIIENRMGASGSIGMMDAARATPDGYTLLFGAFQQISVLPYTEKVNYDAKKDYAFISIFGEGPFVLAINSSVPAKSLTEFIAYAKSKPRALAYASGGMYSGVHLMAALLFRKAGADLVHVPYRGGGPAVAALLGGQVQAYLGNASELIPLKADPHIRILATTTAKPMQQLPGVPTVSQFFPGFVFTSWNGLMAPAKTPRSVKAKLEAATIEAAHDPSTIKALSNIGITSVGSTSKEFSARIEGEAPLLADAMRAARSSAQH